MRRNTLGAVIFLAASILRAQQIPALPAWLENYPGASPDVRASDSMVESSYTAAKVGIDQVLAHYRKILEAAKLEFQANPDGIGTTIRAGAPECDLLIQLRERSEGTSVHVYCSTPSKSPAGVPVVSQSQPARAGVNRAPVTAAPQIPADLMARHKQVAAEMGIGRQHPDAPAPPLVWPSWLAHIQGAPLHPQRGTNYAKDETLTARYLTSAPMTEIYAFYRDALKSHEYPGSSELATGQTLTGVKQNALGYVEGANYPDGAPGARTEIKVSFSRDVLNGPITVILTFTTHAYIAGRGY